MAAQADERVMISERIAPGMLPRVLNSFDMTIIFVAIVLFIVNASAIQQAHQAAYTYWILGFVAFLIPGALVAANPRHGGDRRRRRHALAVRRQGRSAEGVGAGPGDPRGALVLGLHVDD